MALLIQSTGLSWYPSPIMMCAPWPPKKSQTPFREQERKLCRCAADKHRNDMNTVPTLLLHFYVARVAVLKAIDNAEVAHPSLAFYSLLTQSLTDPCLIELY